MKALIKEAGEVRIVDVPRPEVRRPDDVVIQVLVAGICRTDLYVASGEIPSAEPITLGHEFAGRVTACGEDAVFATGDLVTADPRCVDGFLGVDRHGAFAEYVVLPAANVFRLPGGLDPRAGAYVEPVAAALAAPSVLDAERHARNVTASWRGLVYGNTRFGRLVTEVLRTAGYEAEVFSGSTTGSFDFAVETSGTARELAQLVDALTPNGVLLLKSRKPGAVEIPLHQIVAKNLTIRAQQYGRFEVALALVAGKIDLSGLFGETFPLARHRIAFARASEDESRKLFLSCAD